MSVKTLPSMSLEIGCPCSIAMRVRMINGAPALTRLLSQAMRNGHSQRWVTYMAAPTRQRERHRFAPRSTSSDGVHHIPRRKTARNTTCTVVPMATPTFRSARNKVVKGAIFQQSRAGDKYHD